MKRSIFIPLAIAALLNGCAYTTAKRVTRANENSLGGIPIFAPKTFLIVNGQQTTKVTMPDCSQEYRVQFGTAFAKNDVTMKIADGMLSELVSNQDSTALPLEIIKFLSHVAGAGKGVGSAFSEKAEGSIQNRFGIFDIDCETGQVRTVNPNNIRLEYQLVELPTSDSPTGGPNIRDTEDAAKDGNPKK